MWRWPGGLRLSIFNLLGIGFGYDGLSVFWWRDGRGERTAGFLPSEEGASLLFSGFDNVLSQMSAGERWLVLMRHFCGSNFFPAVDDTSLCG